MTADFATLSVDLLPDRAVVVLNRPAVRNAIDSTMVAELHRVCGRLEEHPVPLLLTGSGDVFSAGADVRALRERGREEALQGINSRLFDRVAALPQPTVALVNGPAVGGGAELTYACDIRLAATGAVFRNPEPALGIMAAAGACWRLPELTNKAVAKQVLLGGYSLDAARALELGLVAEVLDPAELLGRGHRLIEQILRSSALALRLTKLTVDAPQAHPIGHDLAQAILFETQDKKDRMTNFLDSGNQ